MDHTPYAVSPHDLIDKLGTFHLPQLIDVRLPEDICETPHRLPTARHVRHRDVAELAEVLDRTRSVVTICHRGLKLSHGVAAHLRSAGFSAQVLYGGSAAWRDAQYPTLSLTTCPTTGTPWVLPATKDRRAPLSAWIVRRWFDANATLLWVPPDHVQDVAQRFDAQAWSGETALTSTCTAFGLTNPDVLTHVDAIETGKASGSNWIDMLPNLHETDEDLVEAALPVLDAAWLAHRQLIGQDST